MPTRRTIVLGLAAWVIVLFVAGAVWRSFHPATPDSGPSQDRLVASRQDGYYACLHLPSRSPVRLDLAARARFLARKFPQDDQPSALDGCAEAIRR
jgi:hypothetical protein